MLFEVYSYHTMSVKLMLKSLSHALLPFDTTSTYNSLTMSTTLILCNMLSSGEEWQLPQVTLLRFLGPCYRFLPICLGGPAFFAASSDFGKHTDLCKNELS